MIDAISPTPSVSVYYENRISYEQKWGMNGRTMSITESPHIEKGTFGKFVGNIRE